MKKQFLFFIIVLMGTVSAEAQESQKIKKHETPPPVDAFSIITWDCEELNFVIDSGYFCQYVEGRWERITSGVETFASAAAIAKPFVSSYADMVGESNYLIFIYREPRENGGRFWQARFDLQKKEIVSIAAY